ncbi:MAG: Gfo/Idh/MocA family oxidoreductase [Verrucomicrobiota bacterium]|nr:Gfo/Idh/MocA family oxidoreductase [Verrucomicrobiota bacterium]
MPLILVLRWRHSGVNRRFNYPKNMTKTPSNELTRRKFLSRSSTALGASAFGPFILRGQNLNGKINLAAIGAGGKGSSDTDNSARCGANVVALCDVDLNTLRSRGQKYPGAALYQDFRKMLEKEKSIDAVTVSTPDHMHAVAGVMAMKMGKHAYVQKPLTQSVYEARLMRKVAKEQKVATQMGNQGSAGSGLRRAVQVIQSGIIGDVTELHVWSNRPVWPQGIDRPKGSDPVPDHLNWDLWQGPVKHRPYKSGVYHTFKWRGWLDYGTGALGDMACHTVNMPFRALKLGYPTVVEAEDHSGMNKETYPLNSRIRFEFPEREGMVPLKFWWYDGKKEGAQNQPNKDTVSKIRNTFGNIRGSGCLLIGTKGQIYTPDDYGSRYYISLNDEKKFKDSKKHEADQAIESNYWQSPGHTQEWFDMMKGGRTAYSNFDNAAYLTEIILLGCIAMQVGKNRKMEWDGPNMKSPNIPEAANYVKREYLNGYTL